MLLPSIIGLFFIFIIIVREIIFIFFLVIDVIIKHILCPILCMLSFKFSKIHSLIIILGLLIDGVKTHFHVEEEEHNLGHE